jgi:hypothetical protein
MPLRELPIPNNPTETELLLYYENPNPLQLKPSRTFSMTRSSVQRLIPMTVNDAPPRTLSVSYLSTRRNNVFYPMRVMPSIARLSIPDHQNFVPPNKRPSVALNPAPTINTDPPTSVHRTFVRTLDPPPPTTSTSQPEPAPLPRTPSIITLVTLKHSGVANSRKRKLPTSVSSSLRPDTSGVPDRNTPCVAAPDHFDGAPRPATRISQSNDGGSSEASAQRRTYRLGPAVREPQSNDRVISDTAARSNDRRALSTAIPNPKTNHSSVSSAAAPETQVARVHRPLLVRTRDSLPVLDPTSSNLKPQSDQPSPTPPTSFPKLIPIATYYRKVTTSLITAAQDTPAIAIPGLPDFASPVLPTFKFAPQRSPFSCQLLGRATS